MNRVLVTGGAGFVGSHLVECLIERGYEVLVYDDYSSGRKVNLPEKGWKGVNDPHEVMEEWMPVFHLAAHADISWSQREPFKAFDADFDLTRRLVASAQRKWGGRFIFVSSSAVYANSGTQKEDGGILDPATPYAVSKLAGEGLTYLLAKLGTPSISIRPFNVYGPRQRVGGVDKPLVPSFLLAKMRGEPFRIEGDGSQTLDFAYVKDIAESLAALLDVPPEFLRGQPVNFGSGHSYSVLEMAKIIGGGDVKIEKHPPRKWFFERTRPDLQRAEGLGLLRSQTSIRQGITATEDYYRDS